MPEAPPPSAVTVDDSPAINSRKAISVSINNAISPRSAWMHAEQAATAREYNLASGGVSPSASSYAGGTASARMSSAVGPSPATSAISAARRRRSNARRSTVDPYNDFAAYDNEDFEEGAGAGGTFVSSRGKAFLACLLLAVVFFNYPRTRPWQWSLLSGRRSGGSLQSSDSGVSDVTGGPNNTTDAEANQAVYEQHVHLALADALNDQLSKKLAEIERTSADNEQHLEEWQRQAETHISQLIDAQKAELRETLAAGRGSAAEGAELVELRSKVQNMEKELAKTRELMRHLSDEVKKKALREEKDDSVAFDYESVLGGISSDGGYRSSPPMADGRVASKELAKTVLQLWRDVHLGGTGVRNWALEVLGSSIVQSMTTPGVNHGNIVENVLRRLSMLNPTGRYMGRTTPLSKAASVVLKSGVDMQPGDNFAFNGPEANITVNLGTEIVVESVGVEHPMPELIVDHSLAPKVFDVWGLPRPTFLSNQQNSDGSAAPAASAENGWILLAKDLTFEYPKYRLQVYPTTVARERCRDPNNADRSGCAGSDVLPVRRVAFNFRENHGGAWTSVYRLRVHGRNLEE